MVRPLTGWVSNIMIAREKRPGNFVKFMMTRILFFALLQGVGRAKNATRTMAGGLYANQELTVGDSAANHTFMGVAAPHGVGKMTTGRNFWERFVQTEFWPIEEPTLRRCLEGLHKELNPTATVRSCSA